MHKKGRTRGKNLRYVKNPTRSFFQRSQSDRQNIVSKNQANIKQVKKNRKPRMPKSTTPEDNKN
jgi:hypothetical protein